MSWKPVFFALFSFLALFHLAMNCSNDSSILSFVLRFLLCHLITSLFSADVFSFGTLIGTGDCLDVDGTPPDNSASTGIAIGE